MLEKGKVIVVDDCIEDARRLKKELQKYLEGEEIYILNRFDPEFIKNNLIDLMFLDIELGENMNGIKEVLAYQDKQASKINVIFVSSHHDFVFDSIPANPIYFVRKDRLKYDLQKAFETLDKNNFRKKPVVVHVDEVVKIEDIIYIESDNHDVLLHLKNKTVIRERKSLADYEKELRKYRFIRCHHSYLINAYCILRRRKETLTMIGNIKLHISRSYTKTFETAYREFVFERYG